MIEVERQDIWENDNVIITTNGFVKKNGEAVMGRGIAKEARDMINISSRETMDVALGKLIRELGNIPFYMGFYENTKTENVYRVWTYPTKNNWYEKSDLDLIIFSAKEISKMIDAFEVHMPRPGCGNGGLLWQDVKPVIEHILDDRFIVHGGK